MTHTFFLLFLAIFHLTVTSDVLLLADVFETFLDPTNYYTSRGLSWDALRKKTQVELELLTDYDQHQFIKKDSGVVYRWYQRDTPDLNKNI